MEPIERDFGANQCDFCNSLRRQIVLTNVWKDKYLRLALDCRRQHFEIKNLQEKLLEYTRGFTDLSENIDET